MRPNKTWTAFATAAVLGLATPASASGGGLELIPNPVVLLVLLIGFSLLIIPVNVFIFRPLFGVLDEREGRISGARRRAEKLERDADEVLSRYQAAVDEVRAEAQQDRRAQLDEARAEHSSITAQARGEAEQKVEAGRAELVDALAEARLALRDEARELAQQAARQILGRSLS